MYFLQRSEKLEAFSTSKSGASLVLNLFRCFQPGESVCLFDSGNLFQSLWQHGLLKHAFSMCTSTAVSLVWKQSDKTIWFLVHFQASCKTATAVPSHYFLQFI